MGYMTLIITNKLPEICTGGLEPFAKVWKSIYPMESHPDEYL